MRHALIVGLVAAAFISTAAAHIKPPNSGKPLFRILRFRTLHGGDQPQGVADDEHPLLVVWSLRDAQLARDNKGVLITLTPKDTKTFASITRRHGYLIFDVGEGRPIEVLHITARSQMASSVSNTPRMQQLPNTYVVACASVNSHQVQPIDEGKGPIAMRLPCVCTTP